METTIHAVAGFSEPIASWTHLVGAIVALSQLGSVLRADRPLGTRLNLAGFALAATFALAASAAYHAAPPGPLQVILRQVDHAAIWILIAATFHAAHGIAFRGLRRWGVLAFVWPAALAGVVAKTLFFDAVPETIGLALYLALGWMGLVTGTLLAGRHGWGAVVLLVAGGLIYSVGAVVAHVGAPPLVQGFVGHHELFHLAVLGGLRAHWAFLHRVADLVQARAVVEGAPLEEPAGL